MKCWKSTKRKDMEFSLIERQATRRGLTCITQNQRGNPWNYAFLVLLDPRNSRPSFRAKKDSVLATVFRDNEGVILIDFWDQGTTINSDRYFAILHKLKEAIRHKRPELNIRHTELLSAQPVRLPGSIRGPSSSKLSWPFTKVWFLLENVSKNYFKRLVRKL